jgi:hypothetical protein
VELADLAQNYFGDTRTGSLAGPFGAFLIAALAVTTVLLIRNMNARIRRLPERFPDQVPDEHHDEQQDEHPQDRPQEPGAPGTPGTPGDQPDGSPGSRLG